MLLIARPFEATDSRPGIRGPFEPQPMSLFAVEGICHKEMTLVDRSFARFRRGDGRGQHLNARDAP